MNCGACGHAASEGDGFCSQCGAPFTVAPRVVVQSPEPELGPVSVVPPVPAFTVPPTESVARPPAAEHVPERAQQPLPKSLQTALPVAQATGATPDSPAPAVQPTAGPRGRDEALLRRYRDGYRVANTVVGIGCVVKIGGIAIAVLIVLGFGGLGLLLGTQSGFAGRTPFGAPGAELGLGIMLAGAIPAAVVALASWILGVVISAQGQMLLASLDTAVSVSPFLEPDQKARVLGLPA